MQVTEETINVPPGGEESSMNQLDPMDAPVPGQSLTSDPQNMPYEGPPETSDPQEAISNYRCITRACCSKRYVSCNGIRFSSRSYGS